MWCTKSNWILYNVTKGVISSPWKKGRIKSGPMVSAIHNDGHFAVKLLSFTNTFAEFMKILRKMHKTVFIGWLNTSLISVLISYN